jgi:molybdopterin/thiamine biosynthesis adenylyltransferase
VVVEAGEQPADLATEVSSSGGLGTSSSFAGRRLAVVGAGALANCVMISLALDDLAVASHAAGTTIDIWDGDPTVEETNLNRQILLGAGLGTGKPKARVLCEELRSFDPAGQYTPHVQFVGSADDLPSLASSGALICAPDNDRTRLLCGQAARQAGVLYGTAGSSAIGAQAVVCQPGRACLPCVLGRRASPSGGTPAPQASSSGASCQLVVDDAVVSANMVAAGLLVSELREALSGRRSANVRYVGDTARGNQLVKMISDPPCPHTEVRIPGKE